MPAHLSPSLSRPPHYAHAVQLPVGSTLLLTAGGVPLDAAGRLVGEGDVVTQTRQVLANLDVVLADQGASRAGVLRTTVYVAARTSAELAAVWDVLVETGWANGTIAATLLGVTVLGYAGQLVEVDVIAAV